MRKNTITNTPIATNSFRCILRFDLRPSSGRSICILSFPVKLYLFMICSVYFSGAIAPGTILPISCLEFCQQLESFLAILHYLISKRPLRSNCHHIPLLTQLFLFIFIIIFNISKVHTMVF